MMPDTSAKTDGLDGTKECITKAASEDAAFVLSFTVYMKEREQIKPVIGKSLESGARAVAIQKASADEALDIVSQYYPEGSNMGEGFAVSLILRGKDLAEREQMLDILRTRFQVTLGPRILETLLQKTKNLSQAKEVLEKKYSEL